MKNLLWLFLFLSVSLTAQVQDTAALVGKFFGSQSGGGAGYWTVTGTFTDESGLYDSGQIEVGDILFFGDAGYGYFLPITVIVSATPPSFTVRVSNVGITGVGAVPTGSGAIFKGRPNHLINPFASGLTNPDQQTYLAYAWDLIDNIGGGGTTYFPADGIQFLSDSIAVDSSVMRYNIYPGQVNDGTSTGYWRHNNGWGNQWTSVTNGGEFIYHNKVVNDLPDQAQVEHTLTALPTLPGGGGIAQVLMTYGPGGMYAHLEAYNTAGLGSEVQVGSAGNITIGGNAGAGVYIYELPAEELTLNVDEIAYWEWNGSTHVAKFLPVDSVVQAIAGPFTYQVTVSGANSGSNLFITASKLGVTASYASNQLTVTIPAGTTVHAADWRLVAADIQSSADAGGVTNWTRIRFEGTPFNTGLTDLRMPTVQKLAIPNSGALSLTNAATLDTDNNPAVSVTDVGSNAITIRVGGLSVGAQGFNLKITNL